MRTTLKDVLVPCCRSCEEHKQCGDKESGHRDPMHLQTCTLPLLTFYTTSPVCCWSSEYLIFRKERCLICIILCSFAFIILGQVEMVRNPELRDRPLGIQQKNIGSLYQKFFFFGGGLFLGRVKFVMNRAEEEVCYNR